LAVNDVMYTRNVKLLYLCYSLKQILKNRQLCCTERWVAQSKVQVKAPFQYWLGMAKCIEAKFTVISPHVAIAIACKWLFGISHKHHPLC
jgi:hypothetical protein